MKCQAEIGHPGKLWCHCGRKATHVAREKRYRFGDLYYCEKHASHGKNPVAVAEPWNREIEVIK